MDNKPQISILFLSADPSEASRLRLGQELRDIREKLQLAKLRDRFTLEARTSLRPGDITQAILDIEPLIVHFSGHGLRNGHLCFENDQGQIHPITPDALESLFELVADQVQCVVLNACFSAKQAEHISRHIPYVIGMTNEIGDQAAIAFATGFYKALGAGRSIESSFKFGLVELKLLNIPEHLTPKLEIGNRSRRTDTELKREANWLPLDFEILLSDFRNVLEIATNKKPILSFLEQNPIMLPLGHRFYDPYIISDFSLDSEHVVDFAACALNQSGYYWTFIRFEMPGSLMFSESNLPTRQLTQSVNEVQRWRRWASNNQEYCKTLFHKSIDHSFFVMRGEKDWHRVDDLGALIVIGRKDSLNEHTRDMLHQMNTDYRGSIEIMTYDRILDRIESFIRHARH